MLAAVNKRCVRIVGVAAACAAVWMLGLAPAMGQSSRPAGQPASSGNVVVPGQSAERIEEIHVKDLDLAAALRMLTMQTKDNVVLSSKVDGSQKIEANLYNVTFEQVLESILTPLGLAYQRDGNFIYVYTRKELAELAKQQRVAGSAIFKLHYITAADAAVLVKPLLSSAGQVAVTAPAGSGIDSGGGDTGGNSYSTQDALVVTDYPENIEQISRVVKDMDVRPRQVLIEATILRATLDETNSLGVDFNTFGGIDFANLDASSSSGSTTTSSGGTTTTVNNPTAAGTYPANAEALNGGLPTNYLNQTTFNIKTDFLDPALFPRGGFSFGIIKNNIAAFIRALEEVTDTTVVANPKVLALNKQKGEVIVGRRDGYLTTITTETETLQKVEFLETGVQLIFRPYIGDDGFVRMELHPKDSSGALTAANLPFEETTEVITNILVKDGHTIVIGGLFRERSRASRAQVPWLGNIPYAGVLFRRRADNTLREEVIILLTTHIVEDNQAYAAAGEKALEDVERLRVGLRQSMMPHGRERLAQAHYKWAMEHMEAGRIDKALWDLKMATHLNPRFMDALQKREQLMNRRIWDANGTLTRNFIYNRLIGAEDSWIDAMGRPVPPGQVVPPPDADSAEWGEPIRTMRGPTGPKNDETLLGAPAAPAQSSPHAAAAQPQPAPQPQPSPAPAAEPAPSAEPAPPAATQPDEPEQAEAPADSDEGPGLLSRLKGLLPGAGAEPSESAATPTTSAQ